MSFKPQFPYDDYDSAEIYPDNRNQRLLVYLRDNTNRTIKVVQYCRYLWEHTIRNLFQKD